MMVLHHVLKAALQEGEDPASTYMHAIALLSRCRTACVRLPPRYVPVPRLLLGFAEREVICNATNSLSTPTHLIDRPWSPQRPQASRKASCRPIQRLERPNLPATRLPSTAASANAAVSVDVQLTHACHSGSLSRLTAAHAPAPSRTFLSGCDGKYRRGGKAGRVLDRYQRLRSRSRYEPPADAAPCGCAP